jgi:hypothetical protein
MRMVTATNLTDATGRGEMLLKRVTMTERDADRLELLDRIAERVPELALDRHSVEWNTLDDGSEALLVDGGGIDGGDGAYFANCGEDVHAVGTLAPLVPGYVGCIVIGPDGSRRLARVVPDPLT